MIFIVVLVEKNKDTRPQVIFKVITLSSHIQCVYKYTHNINICKYTLFAFQKWYIKKLESVQTVISAGYMYQMCV